MEGDILLAGTKKITVFAVESTDLPPDTPILLGVPHLRALSVSLDFALLHPHCEIKEAMKFGCLSPFREGFRSPLRQDSVSVFSRFSPTNSQLEPGLLGALVASALWCLFWLVSEGLSPTSLVALSLTPLKLEVVLLVSLLVSVWTLVFFFRSFLSLPLRVAPLPRERGLSCPEIEPCSTIWLAKSGAPGAYGASQSLLSTPPS